MKIKTIITALITSILLLISANTLAETRLDEINKDNLFSSIDGLSESRELDDVAKLVLKTAYGDGIFDLDERGEEITTLTILLGFVNIAALIYLTLSLAYHLFTGAVNTATSGQPLGKQYSSWWLPLRIGIAFSLLMPGTAPGAANLSIAQFLVIKLVFVSSNLATSANEIIVKKVFNNDISVVSSVQAPRLESYVDMANSAICSYQEKHRVSFGGSHWSFFPRPHYTINGYTADGSEHEIVSNEMPSEKSFLIPEGYVIKSIKFSASSVCGKMSLFNGKDEQTMDGSWKAYQNASRIISETLNYYTKLAIRISKDSLYNQSIASAYDNEYSDTDPKMDEARMKIERYKIEISNHVKQYPAAMVSAVQDGFNAANDVEEIKKKIMPMGESWILAGNSVLQFTEYSSARAAVANKIRTTISNGSWRTCMPGVDGCKLDNGGSSLGGGSDGSARTPSLTKWYAIIEEVAGNTTIQKSRGVDPSTSGLACDSLSCDPMKLLDNASSDIGFIVLDVIRSNGGETTYAEKTSIRNSVAIIPPTLILAEIGNGLNSAALSLVGTGLAATIAANALSNSPAQFLGAGGFGEGVNFVLLFAMPLIYTVIFSGWLLAYYIPIDIAIKFMLFVINWLFHTVEAMIFVPLILVNLITPEGDGIAGTNMERAKSSIIMMIVRPLVGLIALSLALVGHYIAWQLAVNLFFGNPSAYNHSGFIDTVLRTVTFTIYISLAITAINNIIFGLANQISENFGAPQRHLDTNVEGEMKGAASKIEGGLSQGMSGATSAMNGAADKAREGQANKGFAPQLEKMSPVVHKP